MDTGTKKCSPRLAVPTRLSVCAADVGLYRQSRAQALAMQSLERAPGSAFWTLPLLGPTTAGRWMESMVGWLWAQ